MRHSAPKSLGYQRDTFLTMASITILTQSDINTIRHKIETYQTGSHDGSAQIPCGESRTRGSSRPHQTLQDQRDLKQKEREKKLAAAEALRVEIDRRHAEAEASRKMLLIERSNRMLWDEREDSRAFQSKLLLSEVLAERECQLRWASKLEEKKKLQASDFLEKQRLELQRAQQVEEEKAAAAKARALQQRNVQLQQLSDLKCQLLAERELARQEGDLIRAKAQEEAAVMKRKEEALRQRAKQADAETKAANEALQTFKLLEMEQNCQLEEAIREYAKEKEVREENQRAAQQAKQRAKDEQRRHMVEMMEQTYGAFHSQSEERLERDIAQSTQAAEAKMADEKRQAEENWASIDRSRKAQLTAKKVKLEATRTAEKAFAEAWQQRLSALKSEEVNDSILSRENHQKHVNFLREQIGAKASKRSLEKIKDDQEDYARLYSLQKDHERFLEYARICTEEWARCGRSTKPMQQILKKQAKTCTGLQACLQQRMAPQKATEDKTAR